MTHVFNVIAMNKRVELLVMENGRHLKSQMQMSIIMNHNEVKIVFVSTHKR